jgi:hypothetical protein
MLLVFGANGGHGQPTEEAIALSSLKYYIIVWLTSPIQILSRIPVCFLHNHSLRDSPGRWVSGVQLIHLK